MNPALRGLIIYVFLLIVFRITGKRSLSESGPFELILLLIISEVTQQALLGEDFSLTSALILILTLVGIDQIFAMIKLKHSFFNKIVDGVTLLLVSEGRLLQDRMRKAQVEREDILEAARRLHGLQRLDQVRYAVLETDGSISIIPQPESGT